MALPIETLFADTFTALFGNPIFMLLSLLAFFFVVLIFGRVGLLGGTPVMIGVFIFVGDIVPAFKIPFLIILGFIIGFGFLRIYKGGS